LGGFQLLGNEVKLVSGRIILKHSKDPLSEFLNRQGSRLKIEGVEECIGAAALDRIKFRTLRQFRAKAMPRAGAATASVLTCSQAAEYL
jgi:hypothetical protein